MVAPIQALLRRPGLRDDRVWGSLLPPAQRVPDKRSVARMPRRFDQHAPHVATPRASLTRIRHLSRIVFTQHDGNPAASSDAAFK